MVVPEHVYTAAATGELDVLREGVRLRVVDREERDMLERLFAWAPGHATDSRRRTRSAQAAVRASHITPLPRGVFKLVLSFWESDRDWRWGY